MPYPWRERERGRGSELHIQIEVEVGKGRGRCKGIQIYCFHRIGVHTMCYALEDDDRSSLRGLDRVRGG